MNLYVMELLKRNGEPYKQARFVSEPITIGGRVKIYLARPEWMITDRCRIRTLALLPAEA